MKRSRFSEEQIIGILKEHRAWLRNQGKLASGKPGVAVPRRFIPLDQRLYVLLHHRKDLKTVAIISRKSKQMD